MYYKILVVWLCISLQAPLPGQEASMFTGVIIDSLSREPIPGAHVSGDNFVTHTDTAGQFHFEAKTEAPTRLRVTHIGYFSKVIDISISDGDPPPMVLLAPSITTLEAVKVQGKTKQGEARETPLVTISVSKNFLEANRENSLMQTLKKLPGIGSMDIGSGQSKPTIRGLGFNRVVVVQDGIKHEAQQWGVDHGLEIDQFGIGDIRIIKGPASLLYGSDAIAGTIVIESPPVPLANTRSGEVNLTGQTNNQLMGISAFLQARKDKWFYRGQLTYRNYGDYRVPTDKISYDNYIFELHNNFLRNTAGREFNSKFDFGWLKDDVSSVFTLSNVYNKGGFFANAHQLEVRTSKIDYDHSSRDIDLPFHFANHFKLNHNTTLSKASHSLQIDWGFQYNHREEHAEPTAHGYMPKPDHTLERNFKKNTFSLHIQDAMRMSERLKLTAGMNAQYQENIIGGWGFLIPEFQRITYGVYTMTHLAFHSDFHVQGGLRYDNGIINTKPYFDWFETPVKNKEGTISHTMLQRAYKDRYQFDNWSASIGLSYLNNNTTYKFNLGKSFRIPLAHELASDGVNYHMYRFEKGNPHLDAEVSYQLDFEINHEAPLWSLGISPFINFFENYIYLNPGFDYYESLQKYEYDQGTVLRTGGELQASITILENLNLLATGEYVWSRHQSGTKKGFTLPFSPPLSFLFTASYRFDNLGKFGEPHITIDYRETAAQHRIVPPEKRTRGYRVFNVSLHTDVDIFKKHPPLKLRIKINNIFHTQYFDHSSFYRLIDVPEPGRNAAISIILPFNN